MTPCNLLNFMSYVPKCLTCSRFYVPYCMRAFVLYMPTYLHAFVSYMSTCLLAFAFCRSSCLRAFVFHEPTCLHTFLFYALTYPCVLPTCVRLPKCISRLCTFGRQRTKNQFESVVLIINVM